MRKLFSSSAGTVSGNVIVNTIAGVPPATFQSINKRLSSPVAPGALTVSGPCPWSALGRGLFLWGSACVPFISESSTEERSSPAGQPFPHSVWGMASVCAQGMQPQCVCVRTRARACMRVCTHILPVCVCVCVCTCVHACVRTYSSHNSVQTG